MRIIKSLLIILSMALCFTACKKEETIERYDSISGVLTPGENVTTEDLAGLDIYLGRFHDTIDFSSITFSTTAIDSVGATLISADGSFAFTGLAPGNYGIALEEGYIFSIDTAVVVQLDGKTIKQINKSVDLCPLENLILDPPNEYGYSMVKFKLNRGSLSSIYQIKKMHAFHSGYHSSYEKTINVPSFTSELIIEWGEVPLYPIPSTTFEIWIYDQEGIVTDTLTTGSLPTRPVHYKLKKETFRAGPIDITWVPHTSGFFWWQNEEDGYYLFNEH